MTRLKRDSYSNRTTNIFDWIGDTMKKEILRCEACNKRIEILSEKEIMNALESHGWSNLETAQLVKCFDCASPNDPYETYYAGRIKRGHPNKVFRLMPDLENEGKLIEVYSGSEWVKQQ